MLVPSQCKYVIDVRVNELYTFDEILDALKNNLQSQYKPRTTRMKSTSIPLDHPLVKQASAWAAVIMAHPPLQIRP